MKTFLKHPTLSFAIDSSQWVMTPVDTSVTFTGNSVLSALDIAKMECLYYCDGTNPGTCGGHKYGEDGQKSKDIFRISTFPNFR